MDSLSPLAMEGLALELMAEASREARGVPEAAPPRWLLLVREQLHAQFAESLSLEEIAKKQGDSSRLRWAVRNAESAAGALSPPTGAGQEARHLLN